MALAILYAFVANSSQSTVCGVRERMVIWLVVGCRLSVVGCLEDNTERSESNPGRSLGIITKEKRAVWKTVPDNMLLRLRLCPHALKKFTDNTDATDFIFSRI